MKLSLGLAPVLFALSAAALAQTDLDKVQIVTTPLGHGLAMLAGAGGNIVASTGEDGIILVDDQFEPLHEKIKAALAKLSDKPLRFVINTHWHGDHTGGNLKFAVDGAVVIAQDNVYQRMSTEQFIRHLNRTVPASPKGALPIVTFNDRATLHLNGEAIHLIHVRTRTPTATSLSTSLTPTCSTWETASSTGCIRSSIPAPAERSTDTSLPSRKA
jgi:glyoxylase-like metal-dependent hydrolase (beta-lactamase superfamily II)